MMTTVTRGKVLHYIFIEKFKYGKKYKHGHYTMIHIWALHMAVHKCQFMPIKFLKIVKFLIINLFMGYFEHNSSADGIPPERLSDHLKGI